LILLFAVLLLASPLSLAQVRDPNPLPGGSQDPSAIPKYVDALPIPQAMPKIASTNSLDYYIVGARQFKQQILPSTFNATTVFGYGSLSDSSTFSYPARTIEAQTNRPVRVTWVNGLVDSSGKYVPHLFSIDQTLHWANPPQDCYDFKTGKALPRMPDCRGHSQQPYTGPVPIVTHLHGAHVQPDSDGYPQAWYLPPAVNIPTGYANKGSNYGQIPGFPFTPGAATYQYPNNQRSTTLWYHDHVLGMTRANVYAGLAGFYLLRDTSDPAGLPSGAFEIPLLIQDKSFNTDGSLFFPGDRAFFEGLSSPSQLQIPFIPDTTLTNKFSDVSPIWNPEFFGNVMVVNGKSWPKMNVQQRRYRLRIVNGDDTRVLILKFAADPLDRPSVAAKGVQVWQIGADGGFLPKPVKLNEMLIAPAERVDLIVDFTNASGDVFLINEGPDQPFGGGRAPVDFAFADPSTTGQVMKFTVGPRVGRDASTPPISLTLPARVPLGKANSVRTVSVNEADSSTVFVVNVDGNIVESTSADATPMAPTEGLLGSATVNKRTGVITPIWKEWMDDITENPLLGATEIWEIYDFTEDAHPIHLHQVEFEVINREDIAIDPLTGTAKLAGNITGPEAGETGTKDTVLVYPGRVTRVKAKFDIPGLYVWHCHILSHEDNEMMRPYCVGDKSACNTMPMP
jgi:bilirubin oxidase